MRFWHFLNSRDIWPPQLARGYLGYGYLGASNCRSRGANFQEQFFVCNLSTCKYIHSFLCDFSFLFQCVHIVPALNSALAHICTCSSWPFVTYLKRAPFRNATGYFTATVTDAESVLAKNYEQKNEPRM